MRQPLAISVAQPHSVLDDVRANVRAHADMIVEAKARVVVFPELSLTGYSLNPSPISSDDERLGPMVAACAGVGAIALVGAATPSHNGRPHISMLAIDGGGVAVAYDKMWLGIDEKNAFCPGLSPSVIEVDGWRLGLAICKDTGTPEHASVTAELGIDIYVAGVCETDEDHEVQGERAARVIADHNVWVAVASFAGPTGGGFDATAGRSTIWRHDGKAVACLDHRPGQLAIANIDEC